MKRIPMILVLLLAFTFVALPVMSPAAATPVETDAEPDTELTADSEPAGGGKGDPGGLGDGLGVDDPSQVPSSTIDGCALDGWHEMQERVVFLLYVMMFAD